jgi:uroporphyrinogen III methyltransferase/synthase
VDEVVAYRLLEAPPGSEALLRQAWMEGIDAIVFTSGSTVRGFAHLAEQAGVADDLGSVTTIAIGPVTAEAMTAQGWEVLAVASQHSIDGIVSVIEERRAALAADHAKS